MANPIDFSYCLMNIRLLQTPEEGAQTTIHCAICERVENISGSYFMNCREANQKVNSLMFDTALGKEFWEASERITGLVK